MITLAQAQRIAETFVAALHTEVPDLVVIHDATIERDFGWVFFYDSKSCMEPTEPRHAVGGNAPLIVDRKTAKVTVTGTANAIEYYIQEYERER